LITTKDQGSEIEMVYKVKLLSTEDLNELYRVTGPDDRDKYTLYMMKRELGEDDWQVEFDHQLRGYNGCKGNLEQRVRQYGEKGLWPDQTSIGIGIHSDGELLRVLEAKKLGGYNTK
jgi:hypothetical protein